jgi:glycosyltransferase involved in cell wall biosynthesis
MNSTPKVSVIIPTFNRSKLLIERSLASVLRQSFKDFECIVVDDGSTDDTEECVKNVQKTDQRVVYMKIKNSGQPVAQNLGIEAAGGRYIAFNDDDDEYLPNFLETMVSVFDKADPLVGFCSCSFYVKDERNNLSLVTPTLDPFWCSPVGNGYILRRECFFGKGVRFDESHKINDLELRLRLNEAGYRGIIVKKPLRIYYLAPTRNASNSTSNHVKIAKEFDGFFEKREETYRNYGREEYAWVCLYGAVFHLRAGNARGLQLVLKSILAKPSIKGVLYFCFGLPGKRVFNAFFIIREEVMRYIRVHFLNKTEFVDAYENSS